MTFSIDDLIGLFPNIDNTIIKELVDEHRADDEGVVLKSLLLLSPDHWMNKVQNSEEKLMILLRGLPGSGKSTLASAIQHSSFNPGTVAVVSADAFFVDERGDYIYIPSLIEKAHQWTQNKANTAMKKPETRTVVVDNTNLQAWEMQPYCKLAAVQGFSVLLLEPETHWKLKPAILANKTRHGVPIEKIKQMKQRMEAVSLRQVCCNLPPKYQPKVVTLESLRVMEQRYSPVHVAGAEASAIAVNELDTETKSSSEDFQSLLKCFPHLSVDDLYFPFIKAKGNVEVAMNDILDDNSHLGCGGSSSNSSSGSESEDFEISLDATFANQLEARFGSVRNGVNFPGACTISIPPQVAKWLHSCWQTQIKDKMSELEAKRLHSTERGRPTPIRPSSPAILQKFQTTPDDQDSDAVDASWKVVGKLVTPEELRQLKEKRMECFQKASAAYKAKQGGVAGYYSEEGRNLNEKIKNYERNLRLSTYLNNRQGKRGLSMDLHGLSVEVALEQLEWFILDKTETLYKSNVPFMKLEVITGRGSRSKAKIKPAVMNYFTEQSIKFSESNPGCLEVTLRKKNGFM